MGNGKGGIGEGVAQLYKGVLMGTGVIMLQFLFYLVLLHFLLSCLGPSIRWLEHDGYCVCYIFFFAFFVSGPFN